MIEGYNRNRPAFHSNFLRTGHRTAVGVLVVILVAALIIGLGIHSYYQAEQRKKELSELAARLGWRFSPAKDYHWDRRLAEFACLQHGDERYAYNILTGRVNEHAVCGFDYHYETYSTDSKGNRSTHHHYFSAVVLDSGLPLKQLLIRPENFLDKIGEFFGMDDIDFESAQFSREFYVKADDRKFAFDVIHQATMEFLLESPRYTLEMAGPRIIAWRGDAVLDPAEFEQALALILGVVQRLPNYLLREWKGAVP